MAQEDHIYRCLEPRGEMSDIELSAPSPRVDDFNGKTIYFVNTGKNGADLVLKNIMGLMETDCPEAKLVYYPKSTAYSRPEPSSWWQELENSADTVVVGVGD